MAYEKNRISTLRELISKASTANIVALIIILGIVVYVLLYRSDPPELLKSLALLAVSYLFGRAIISAYNR